MQAPLKALTVKLTVECSHCSLPVPLNGPPNPLRCNHCSKQTYLQRWAEVLVDGNKSGPRALYLIGPEKYSLARAHENGPACQGCGHVYPRSELLLQATETHARLDCAECKRPLYGYAAPAWLRQQLPAVVFVYSADLDVAAGEAAVFAQADRPVPKPVAMACPQCAGGLLISAAAERVVECEYCKVSVFLPEELWRHMHPVKTMGEWTLIYSGRLQSVKQLQEEDQARVNAERERAHAERAAHWQAAQRQKRLAEELEGLARADAEAAQVAAVKRARAQRYLLGAGCAALVAIALALLLGS